MRRGDPNRGHAVKRYEEECEEEVLMEDMLYEASKEECAEEVPIEGML